MNPESLREIRAAATTLVSAAHRGLLADLEDAQLDEDALDEVAFEGLQLARNAVLGLIRREEPLLAYPCGTVVWPDPWQLARRLVPALEHYAAALWREDEAAPWAFMRAVAQEIEDRLEVRAEVELRATWHEREDHRKDAGPGL